MYWLVNSYFHDTYLMHVDYVLYIIKSIIQYRCNFGNLYIEVCNLNL